MYLRSEVKILHRKETILFQIQAVCVEVYGWKVLEEYVNSFWSCIRREVQFYFTMLRIMTVTSYFVGVARHF